jgi:glycosyltransferase involved in cell wall biosynthesis
VRARQDEFDIIHVHLSHFIHFPFLEQVAAKTVTTPHGRLDYVDLAETYACWPDFPLISISMRQRRPLPDANWIGNVYHGLPLSAYPTVQNVASAASGYLAFLGRISPDKRVDRAIEIAARAGMPLKIAAKLAAADQVYFDQEIKTLLKATGVEFVGEVDEPRKREFLAKACALLFPIDWPEPFGLVVIEAMACGVPVVAWDNGAMREILDDGVTGFVVNSIDEAVTAVEAAKCLDRALVRQTFEKKFSAARMVADYERIFRGVIDHDRPLVTEAGLDPTIIEGEAMNGGREQATG